MPDMTHTTTIVIVDDEPLQHQVLADYVARTPGLLLQAAFTDPQEALAFLRTQPADLLLLDVQMPLLSGFQLLDLIGPRMQVIITSAYPEFALIGYEYNVVDYLLKPVSYERFLKAVGKIKPAHSNRPPLAAPPGYLFVKSGFKLVKVALDEVLYIEAMKDYAAIMTEGEKVMSLVSLNTLEKKLPGERFVRIHKSYIVPLDKIRAIDKNSVWVGKLELPIGSTYRDIFLQRIREMGIE
jgi:DNA-binding LytR/AlgR family response regulator